jgi:hypothetical protein
MESFTAAAAGTLTTLAKQVPVLLAGDETAWSTATAFTISGVPEVIIDSQVVTSATAAELWLTVGPSYGVLTISDGTSAATIAISGVLGRMELAAWMNPPAAPPPITQPLFNGQPVFGDLSAFSVVPLTGSGGAGIDAFLGNAPGTTIYDFGPGGRGWGISGGFSAGSAAGVAAMIGTLQCLVGIRSTLIFPTGGPLPDNWERHGSCQFQGDELVLNSAGIQQVAGGGFSQSYKLVVRESAGGG